ncbi:helix-turn-helix transcriptional regulator [Clostridium botulinum]|nr:helix-turn-helix transcriptional regulator [Clostridium botulinum]NFN09376.1 helix-turn-helix transcriptional regulator [Clostridium botulinum]NFN32944.1 helix-turn-helix transcriptional regulator [Clostridium botulinum]
MLKKLRISKGITSTFVAKKLKISRDRLRRIEKNEAMLPTEFIPILSELYGVTWKKIISWRVNEWEKKQKKNL